MSATTTDRAGHNTSDRVYQNWSDREAGISDREMPNTQVPFQIAMLAAGATKYSIWLFLLATVIARSLRYFGLALIVKVFGNKAERFIRRYKTKAMIGITVVAAGLWLILS